MRSCCVLPPLLAVCFCRPPFLTRSLHTPRRAKLSNLIAEGQKEVSKLRNDIGAAQQAEAEAKSGVEA